jgi:hypothetical protein
MSIHAPISHLFGEVGARHLRRRHHSGYQGVCHGLTEPTPTYAALVAAMATPDGVWRIDVLRTRSGEVFQMHRRGVIGMYGGAGWAPTGQIRRSVTEVQALLGDALAALADV